MPGILWRLLFAVIGVVLLRALIGPVGRLLGFAISGDLLTVVTVCIAGIAIYYVGWGKGPFAG